MRGGRRGRGDKGKEPKRRSAVYTVTTASAAHRYGVVQTGIVAFDTMIGGGVPRGKVTEIFGPYQSGKTTLMMEIARAFQSEGGKVAWVDGEHAFDPHQFRRMGGDPDALEYTDEIDTTEQFYEFSEQWVEDNRRVRGPKMIGLDSLARLATKHELETPMDKRNLDRAGLIYRGFRRILGPFARTDTAFVYVNQVRERIGVVFGNPETTTGGKGPEFFSTVRVRIGQGTLCKKKIRILADGRQVGIHTVVSVDKCRLMPDGQRTEFRMMHGTGFDPDAGVLRLLQLNGIVTERGVEEFFYKGREVVSDADFVRRHPDVIRSVWASYRPDLAKAAAEAGERAQ